MCCGAHEVDELEGVQVVRVAGPDRRQLHLFCAPGPRHLALHRPHLRSWRGEMYLWTPPGRPGAQTCFKRGSPVQTLRIVAPVVLVVEDKRYARPLVDRDDIRNAEAN